MGPDKEVETVGKQVKGAASKALTPALFLSILSMFLPLALAFGAAGYMGMGMVEGKDKK